MPIPFGSHLKWRGPVPEILFQLEDDHLSEFQVNFIWYDLLQNSKRNFSSFALCSHKTPMAFEQILYKIEFDFIKLLHRVGRKFQEPSGQKPVSLLISPCQKRQLMTTFTRLGNPQLQLRGVKKNVINKQVRPQTLPQETSMGSTDI